MDCWVRKELLVRREGRRMPVAELEANVELVAEI